MFNLEQQAAWSLSLSPTPPLPLSFSLPPPHSLLLFKLKYCPRCSGLVRWQYSRLERDLLDYTLVHLVVQVRAVFPAEDFYIKVEFLLKKWLVRFLFMCALFTSTLHWRTTSMPHRLPQVSAGTFVIRNTKIFCHQMNSYDWKWHYK